MLQRGPHPLPAFLAMLQRDCAADPSRLARVLGGVRRYQQHPAQRSLADRPAVAAAGTARLRDYGGTGPTVVVVPSLINPWHVLDLDADNSLLRWMAAQGLHVLLVDWGTPGDAETRLSLGGYVEQRLLPLLRGLSGSTAIVGYCLGGLLALAAAARLPAQRLVLLACPWNFDGYGSEARATMAQIWELVGPAAQASGLVPIEALQPAFWALDPGGAAAKFERFASLDPASAEARAFVLLEDWANGGPPVAAAAAADMMVSLFRDSVTTKGDWLARLEDAPGCALSIASARDRLVPPPAVARLARHLEVDAGHVGMIVGSRARALLWEPLAAFLRAT